MALSKGGKVLCKVNATTSSAIIAEPVVTPDAPTLKVTSSGAITLNINDVSTGWKLDTGAYTLKVVFTDDAVKEVTQSIVVTDTQPKLTVSRVKMSGSSVDDCFEVYYDGKKQEVKPDYYDAKGKPVAASGTVSVAYAIVTVDVGNNKLTQKINIGLTVRVE